VLCGKSKDGGTGEYMAEVRISSRFERPCAVVEDPRDALADAGEREPRHRKVHSLIDKVYDPNNLEEAWQRVWENRGSAGIDGVTIAAFAEREDELLSGLAASQADLSAATSQAGRDTEGGRRYQKFRYSFCLRQNRTAGTGSENESYL